MITLFAIPKSMEGEFLHLQENAVGSWIRLGFGVEILLFGGERGVETFARRMGLDHVGGVARTEFGTPRVDDLFRQAETLATQPLLCYVNADIILGRNFLEAAGVLAALTRPFLAVGRRWDLDLPETIDYSDPGWEDKLRSRVGECGSLHAATGIDYFIFRRGLWGGIPPFAIGRTMWDNWLILRALQRRAMVIDATQAIWAVHQNHGYNHHTQGSAGVWKGPEAQRNERLAGGSMRLFSIDDATHRLTEAGTERIDSAERRKRWWYTLPAVWKPAGWANAVWVACRRAVSSVRKGIARMRRKPQ